MKAISLAIAAVLAACVLASAEDAPDGPDVTKQVTITITDTSANPGMAAAFEAAIQFQTESTEGYQKGYKLDGAPVREEYQNESKSGSATALVDGRLTVEVRIDGLPPEELAAWLKRVDPKRLAGLKSEEAAGVVHFKKLVAALPDPPAGWTAEKADGSSTQAGEFKVSQASRTYTR
ncbi:MAG: hypothetical protein QOD06_2338 [Candidatus Binatota bacterium]|nr:hypothetical protein [Candidatus Binatota bacterium]